MTEVETVTITEALTANITIDSGVSTPPAPEPDHMFETGMFETGMFE